MLTAGPAADTFLLIWKEYFLKVFYFFSFFTIRALVSVGAVGAQYQQIFSKTELAPTDFKGNLS